MVSTGRVSMRPSQPPLDIFTLQHTAYMRCWFNPGENQMVEPIRLFPSAFLIYGSDPLRVCRYLLPGRVLGVRPLFRFRKRRFAGDISIFRQHFPFGGTGRRQNQRTSTHPARQTGNPPFWRGNINTAMTIRKPDRPGVCQPTLKNAA